MAPWRTGPEHAAGRRAGRPSARPCPREGGARRGRAAGRRLRADVPSRPVGRRVDHRPPAVLVLRPDLPGRAPALPRRGVRVPPAGVAGAHGRRAGRRPGCLPGGLRGPGGRADGGLAALCGRLDATGGDRRRPAGRGRGAAAVRRDAAHPLRPGPGGADAGRARAPLRGPPAPGWPCWGWRWRSSSTRWWWRPWRWRGWWRAGPRRAAVEGAAALAIVVVVGDGAAAALRWTASATPHLPPRPPCAGGEHAGGGGARARLAGLGTATPDDGFRSDGLDHPAMAASSPPCRPRCSPSSFTLLAQPSTARRAREHALVLSRRWQPTITFACLGKMPFFAASS